MTAESPEPGTRLPSQLAAVFQFPLAAAFQKTVSGTIRSSSASTRSRVLVGRRPFRSFRGDCVGLGSHLRQAVKNMGQSFQCTGGWSGSVSVRAVAGARTPDAGDQSLFVPGRNWIGGGPVPHPLK